MNYKIQNPYSIYQITVLLMLMDSKILESELNELDKIIEEISLEVGLENPISAEEIEEMIDALDIEFNNKGKLETIEYYASKVHIEDRFFCLSIAKRMMRSDGDEHELELKAINHLEKIWQI
jgi:hypothetical protein